jgi:hypothetical protein
MLAGKDWKDFQSCFLESYMWAILIYRWCCCCCSYRCCHDWFLTLMRYNCGPFLSLELPLLLIVVWISQTCVWEPGWHNWQQASKNVSHLQKRVCSREINLLATPPCLPTNAKLPLHSGNCGTVCDPWNYYLASGPNHAHNRSLWFIEWVWAQKSCHLKVRCSEVLIYSLLSRMEQKGPTTTYYLLPTTALYRILHAIIDRKTTWTTVGECLYMHWWRAIPCCNFINRSERWNLSRTIYLPSVATL